MQAVATSSPVVRIHVDHKASSRPGPGDASRGESQLAQYVRVRERLPHVRAAIDGIALRSAPLEPELRAVAHRSSVALENRRVIRTAVTPVAVGAIGLGAATATVALAVGLPLASPAFVLGAVAAGGVAAVGGAMGLGCAAIAGWHYGRQAAQAAQDARELRAASTGLEMLASGLAQEYAELAKQEPQLLQAAWDEQVGEATEMPTDLIKMIKSYTDLPAPQPEAPSAAAQPPGS